MAGFRFGGVLLLLLCLTACAVNEKMFSPVSDAERYWNRPGFSIKAPGTSWSRNPMSDQFPDSIVFSRGEGVVFGGVPDKPVYMNIANVVAAGVQLKGPVIDRNDKIVLEVTLRKYLDLMHGWSTKITDSSYDNSLGLECMKYSGTAKQETQPIPGGEVRALPVNGFFCLHPNSDHYAVIMESHNYSTSRSKISFVDEQVGHFFKSLCFAPISSATSRANQKAEN